MNMERILLEITGEANSIVHVYVFLTFCLPTKSVKLTEDRCFFNEIYGTATFCQSFVATAIENLVWFALLSLIFFAYNTVRSKKERKNRFSSNCL